MKFNFFIASVLVCQSLGFRMLRRANDRKERGLSGMERLNKIRMQREGKIPCMHATVALQPQCTIACNRKQEYHQNFKLILNGTYHMKVQHLPRTCKNRLQLEINGHCKINEPEKIKIHFDDRSTDLIIYQGSFTSTQPGLYLSIVCAQ